MSQLWTRMTSWLGWEYTTENILEQLSSCDLRTRANIINVAFESNEPRAISHSLNASGNIFAAGWPDGGDCVDIFTNNDRAEFGRVNVVAWDGNSWIPRGQELIGPFRGSNFGMCVKLSADGNILAISGNSRNSSEDPGFVVVYAWNNNMWVQKGEIIIGELSESFGYSLDMNRDGNILVVGSPLFQGSALGTTKQGRVKVYVWNGTGWTQKGSDIIGELSPFGTGQNTGACVGISENGNTIALCGNFISIAFDSTTMPIIFYDWNGVSWIKRDSANIPGVTLSSVGFNGSLTFQGIKGVENFKYATLKGDSQTRFKLSSDGNTIIVGYPNALILNNFREVEPYGLVRVYDWINNQWIQRGEDIKATTYNPSLLNQYFGSPDISIGYDVDITEDKQKIVVSSLLFSNRFPAAKVYTWGGTEWIGIYLPTQLSEGDLVAVPLAINDHGTVVAAGTQLFSVSSVPEATPTITPTITPTTSTTQTPTRTLTPTPTPTPTPYADCINKWTYTINSWPCLNPPYTITAITPDNIDGIGLPQEIKNRIISSPHWPNICDCNVPYFFIVNGQLKENCICCTPTPTPTPSSTNNYYYFNPLYIHTIP